MKSYFMVEARDRLEERQVDPKKKSRSGRSPPSLPHSDTPYDNAKHKIGKKGTDRSATIGKKANRSQSKEVHIFMNTVYSSSFYYIQNKLEKKIANANHKSCRKSHSHATENGIFAPYLVHLEVLKFSKFKD